MEREKQIYLHADDFGMNVESTERILKCFTEGNLDSVSIMPNGCCQEAARLVTGLPLSIRVHINLVEGKCVSDKTQVSLLVDKEGYFRYSFVGLFFLLLSGKRKEARKQITLEIKKQIQYVYSVADQSCIGIDSHQHIHMIPGVFAALCDAVEELGVEVKELRIPAEPVLPFLKHPSLYPTYRISNIVKNGVLNLLYLFNKKKIRKMGVRQSLFMGIWFSGCMDAGRILKVLPDFCKIAEKKHIFLELLFHPGNILPGEKILDETKPLFTEFYRNEGRKIEAGVLQSEEFYNQIIALTKRMQE